MSNEFQKFVEDIRNKDLGVKKSDKMKVGATEQGKNISTDEVQQFYDEKSKEKELKKKGREEKLKKIKEKKREKLLRARFGARMRGGMRRSNQSAMRSTSEELQDLTQPSTSSNCEQQELDFEEMMSDTEGLINPVEGLESDIQIDEMVVVNYDGNLFPGKVVKICLVVGSAITCKVQVCRKKVNTGHGLRKQKN